MTRLTVAMPVYNAMPYLPSAIKSILEQTYSDFRFIIINDGSTDASAEYLDSITDKRITLIHQDNRGTGNTANRSFDLCDTEFYARMDADDISLPERFKTQLSFMVENRDIVMLGTQFAFIAGQRILPAPATPTTHDDIIKLLLKKKPVLCNSSIIVRMDAVRKTDGYRVNGVCEDFDFFLRMSEIGRLANLDQVFLHYRMHMGSAVATKQDEMCWGIAYAIECSECRRNGKPEPKLDDFKRSWPARGILQKTVDRIDQWSVIQYRKALMDIGNARTLRGVIRLSSAAACRPGTSMRHIITRMLRKRESVVMKKVGTYKDAIDKGQEI